MKKGETRNPARGDTKPGTGVKPKPEQGTGPPSHASASQSLAQVEAAARDAAGAKPPRLPRPGYCHPFVRKQIAEALPELCKAYLGRAKKGDLSTMKLLWQMAELDKQMQSPGTQNAADKKFVRQSLAKYRGR